MSLSHSLLPVFLSLSDPEASPTHLIVSEPSQLATIIATARRHSVLPIVWRKIRERNFFNLIDDPAFASQIKKIDDSLAIAAGQSMLLSHHAKLIARYLQDTNIPFAIVKGPVFAENLYPFPSDRQFTDIDFLVPLDKIDAANAVLAKTGFVSTHATDNGRSLVYREYKWLHPANNSILIELHGDLVHLPRLRQRITFGYTNLIDASDGSLATPGAFLITAILHACCGHKLHNLRLLIDIMQAARKIPRDKIEQLVLTIRKLNIEFEATTVLDIITCCFHDTQIQALAKSFQSGVSRTVSRRLLNMRSIIDAPNRNYNSRVRRDIFRLIQYVK